MSGTKRDGTPIYVEGESFKTGSRQTEDRRAAFIDWLLTPAPDRNPKTKTAFAEEWGVSRQTLTNDARDPEVQKQLAERARAVARVDRLPDILDSLYRIATGTNADGQTKHNRFGETVFPSPAASVGAASKLLDWMADTKDIREGAIEWEKLTDAEITEAVMTLLNKRSDAES